MGLFSFVYGFDPKKLQSQLEGAQDLKKSLSEFNNEVMT